MKVPASKESTQDEVNSNKTSLILEITFEVLILFSFKNLLKQVSKNLE
jgi:hypothetical protein